jgi:Zn-dependent protease with chaperone function
MTFACSSPEFAKTTAFKSPNYLVQGYTQAMRMIAVGFKWLFLFLVAWFACTALNLPWIAMLAAFSWKATGIALIAVAALVAIILLLLPEWGMLKLLQGQVPRTLGLRNSYDQAQRMAGVSSRNRPALVTYSDPVPNVFVVKSFGGHGMILLSEGFVSILDESEICYVLSRAIRHLSRGEIFVQSGCILTLTFLQKSVSFSSKSVKPFRALALLLLFPWIRGIRKIADSSVTHLEGSDSAFRVFVRGSSKISRAGRLYGQQAQLPGLVYLGLER